MPIPAQSNVFVNDSGCPQIFTGVVSPLIHSGNWNIVGRWTHTMDSDVLSFAGVMVRVGHGRQRTLP